MLCSKLEYFEWRWTIFSYTFSKQLLFSRYFRVCHRRRNEQYTLLIFSKRQIKLKLHRILFGILSNFDKVLCKNKLRRGDFPNFDRENCKSTNWTRHSRWIFVPFTILEYKIDKLQTNSLITLLQTASVKKWNFYERSF